MCYGPIVAKRNGLQVIDCKICNHAHLNPIPDESKMREYYDQDRFYAEHSPPGWLMKEVEEFNAGFWNAGYDYQLDLLKGLPILDVGCGIGAFLKRAYQKGCMCFGIEPSKVARSMLSGVGALMYPDLKSLELMYEVSKIPMHVRMALVLEHVPDPVAFIGEYVPLMRNVGKMMIIVPNEFNSLQNRIRKNNSAWFVSDVHVNYFSAQGLRNVMNEAGLKVVHESATFPMELFILAGLDYRNKDELGKKVHKARLHFERTFGKNAFRLYNYLYKKYGWGRELIFVGSRQ